MLLRSTAFLALVVSFSISLAAQNAGSPDPKQRIKAIHEMARQGSSAIPKIAPLLKDPILDVRIEAVKALVDVDTQYSLDPLIQATHDNDSEIQMRATDGLVNFYMPGYVKSGFTASLTRAGGTIKGKFSDTNDKVIDPYIQVRPEVIRALGPLARGGSSMDCRANAARAIGILRGAAAVPDLLESVRTKDSRLIYESLIALQKIRDPSAATGITFLLHDMDEKVQDTAVETVGLLRNKNALPDLRDVLSHARSGKVRRAALSAIAMLPDAADKDLYNRYLKDKDENLRCSAAEGLGRLKDPSALHIVEQTFTGETKITPRLGEAFALVLLGKTEMTEFSPLQYLVDTLNSSIHRGEARAYLIELARDPQIRGLLYPVLAKGTKDEKIHLSQVLAVSGGQDAVPYLDALTRDTDSEVASEAVRSFRTLKSRLP
jgi:HEAT repeat protein